MVTVRVLSSNSLLHEKLKSLFARSPVVGELQFFPRLTLPANPSAAEREIVLLDLADLETLPPTTAKAARSGSFAVLAGVTLEPLSKEILSLTAEWPFALIVGAAELEHSDLGLLLSSAARKRPAGQQSVKLLRAAFDGLQAGVAVVDSKGRIVLTNKSWNSEKAAAPFVGAYAPEGESFLDLCDEAAGEFYDLGQAFASGVRQVLSEGNQFYLEYFTRPAERWFSIRATKAPSGSEVVLAHLDITPRKLAEAQLEQSERVFREISELIAKEPCSFNERLDALLRKVCARFGFDTGAFCRFEGRDVIAECRISERMVSAPTQFLLHGDILSLLASRNDVLGLLDLRTAGAREFSNSLFPGAVALLGCPVYVYEELYGCVALSTAYPRAKDFAETEKLALRFVAQWISEQLEHNEDRSIAIPAR